MEDDQAPDADEVIEESLDPNYLPSEEDIQQYAEWLKLDVVAHPHLRWLPLLGLTTTLPDGWKAVRSHDGGGGGGVGGGAANSTTESVYYWHAATGESTWEHPTDQMVRELLQQEMKRAQEGQVRGIV